jgi:hypothetical protein
MAELKFIALLPVRMFISSTFLSGCVMGNFVHNLTDVAIKL